MTNPFYTEMFDHVKNRDTPIHIENDVIKIHTAENTSAQCNISGNIKIEMQTTKDLNPNYISMFNDREELLHKNIADSDNFMCYIITCEGEKPLQGVNYEKY